MQVYEEGLAFADRMEAMEEEMEERSAEQIEADNAWMREHIENAKAQFGEAFGEDISEDF